MCLCLGPRHDPGSTVSYLLVLLKGSQGEKECNCVTHTHTQSKTTIFSVICHVTSSTTEHQHLCVIKNVSLFVRHNAAQPAAMKAASAASAAAFLVILC